MSQEEHFLEESIRNLQRVAIYGGAHATVTSLLQRYQARLNVVRQQLYTASVGQNASPISRSEVVLSHPIVPVQPNNSVPHSVDIPQVSSTEHAPIPPQVRPVQLPTAPVSSAPQRMFSLRSFFADQTINIVSSLGAFLILIGSLSFVVTTTNLFLSFLVLFLVHLVFATVGFVFVRFPSFRFISRIYTAIFALLVPLVGFSGYRLVAGHLIQLSAPTVVAIAAVYAAIVYAILAVSQQYKPFGYLSVVALMLADFAIAFALQLNYWWWPVLLMPLAFVALLSISNDGPLFRGNTLVLREPVIVLMYACVAMLCLDIICTYVYAIVIDTIGRPFTEIRVAGAIMLLLMLVWTCAYFWLRKQVAWLAVVPYQFLGLVVAFACVFDVQALTYGLLFTAIAVLYHVGPLVVRHSLQRLQHVRNHMEGIALVLIVFVPLLVAPLVPLNLLEVIYSGHDILFPLNGNTIFALIALGVSCALTISIVLSHTGLQRIPTLPHTVWRWLLLLSGLLFTWIYSIVVLSLHIAFAYEFLALTLVLLIGAILVRRSISTAWSNPLDVLVLGEAGLTLLLDLKYGTDTNIALLFLFAVLSYSVVVYQKRRILLFVPVVFMLLAFPALVERPHIMLLLGAGLPLVALVLSKIEQNRRGNTVSSGLRITFTSLFSWEWPLFASGLFYGIVFCGVDALAATSTLQNWLGIPFSVALEMAGLALIWYIAAALTRQQWMLIIAVGFAVASLLMPSNSLWALACVAFGAALVAPIVGRIVAKTWAIPFYVIALTAAVLTGVYGVLGGINNPFPTAVPDALLLYAIVAYAVLVFERQARWLWLVAVFALWSTVLAVRLNTDMFKGISAQVAFLTYYLTGVALVTGGIALTVGRLSKTKGGGSSSRMAAFTWSWPWYCASLFAIVVTVAWNTLMGGVQVASVTVYGSLFTFILLVCVVMLVERRRELLILPIALVLWGTVQAQWELWQQMGALSILFFLVFIMSYLLLARGSSLRIFYTLLSFASQVGILLIIIAQGGLSFNVEPLGQVGIGILLLLAIQLFWYGWMRQKKHYWTTYAAGLLLILTIPWELSMFHLTRIEWLALAPATYLIVIAPFLSRNEHIVQRQRLGQLCSIVGAALLLLPTLWSSFSEPSIQPTFILVGEALALLLLGVTLRTRFFVLSGAALVIVSAMHALFLPSLGLPPSLALTIMGVTLLVVATALSLARHRLQTVWTSLD